MDLKYFFSFLALACTGTALAGNGHTDFLSPQWSYIAIKGDVKGYINKIMNIFEKFFHVEIIHFIFALSIVFLIDAILKSKYKLLPEDKYLERIRRDKSSFIN